MTILTEDLFLEKIRSSNPSGVALNCESNSKSSAEAPATSAGDKSSCGGGVGARKTPYPPVTSNSTKSSYATSSSSSSSSSSAWTKKVTRQRDSAPCPDIPSAITSLSFFLPCTCHLRSRPSVIIIALNIRILSHAHTHPILHFNMTALSLSLSLSPNSSTLIYFT